MEDEGPESENGDDDPEIADEQAEPIEPEGHCEDSQAP